MALFLFFCLGAVFALPAFSQQPARDPALFGDSAIAERYVLWAEKELAAGRLSQALTGLERGADYAPVSADLLYLLAKLRNIMGRPAGTVLEACAAARTNGRWSRYDDARCRLLEAETLIQIREFDRALAVLAEGDQGRVPSPESSAPQGGRGLEEPVRIPESEDAVLLALRCRRGLGQGREFTLLMEKALDSYPRSARLARLLFDYCAGLPRADFDLADLVNLVLRRLPFLLEDDPELAYIASPFMADREDAARFVAAYRAVRKPNPASIPEALSLGLLGGEEAVRELFTFRPEASPPSGTLNLPNFPNFPNSPSEKTFDRALLLEVWDKLGDGAGRELFRRNLLGYSGVIKEDEDKDGFFETEAVFRVGLFEAYRYDADQDGLPEWTLRCNAGVPVEAELFLAGESPAAEGRKKALIRWERYPAVLHVDFDGIRYIPRPLDFFLTPLRFVELVSGGLSYPFRDEFDLVLTERSLLSFSIMTERESAEFPGAIVRTSFQNSIPVSERTWRGAMLIAETDFTNGRPYAQRVDMDNDGRMETIRHFSRNEYGLVISSESDWDGDGIYEYAELLQGNGTVKRYWDLDKDGTRETGQ